MKARLFVGDVEIDLPCDGQPGVPVVQYVISKTGVSKVKKKMGRLNTQRKVSTDLAGKLSKQNKELAAHNKQLSELRAAHKKELAAHNERIKELNAEIDALRAELNSQDASAGDSAEEEASE